MPAPRVERFEPEAEGRKLPPAMIPLLGVAGVAMLVGGLFFVVPDDDGGRPQATDTTVSPSPEPSSSSAGASDKPKKPAKSPKTSTTPSQEPSAKPSTATPSSKPTTVKPPPKPKPGTALVKGCSIVFPATACTATITAKGGPVVWAAEAGGLLYGGGGGKLTAGQTANVTVSIERADPCEAGSDPLVFTPGGSVTVSWTCPAAEPEQPPEDPKPADP